MGSTDNRRPQGQRPQQARPQTQAQTPPQGEQRQPTKLDDVRALVKHRMTPAISRLLAHRSVEDRTRFAQVFLNALEVNPELIECSPGSIARAMQHCAEVDLVPGGAYPHAYLLPYWNKDRKVHEVQFQISVWGYVELIRRAGVQKVWADVIYSGDKYKLTSGSAGKSIEHEPNWFAPRAERGKLVGAYACALLENGEVVCEPVSAEDLELARAQNRGKSPAWELWPDQQRQKVALKRLQKYLPKGPADRALELDEDPGTRPRGIIDAEGHEVSPVDDEPQQQQGPLDRAVEQHKVEQQVQQTQGGSQTTTLDRDQLFGMLCDADERWQTERARVDGWDDIEALSALAFLRTILGDGVGLDGTPPVMPECMRLPRDAA
jgi:recombination protein RecT